MGDKNAKAALFFKKIASCGIGIGFLIFLINCFVSDYILSALCTGIIAASVFIFGFGLCLCLMEEAAAVDRHKRKSFFEKMTYLYWR
ncbi:hypothetical protein ACF5W4_01495 [Bacillota bacterium Lsc_1132]